MYNSKVIVVSGITAGGKTSLVKELIENVDNASALSFDDYSIAICAPYGVTFRRF